MEPARARRVPPDAHGLRARSRRASPGSRRRFAWLLALDEASWRAATRHTALRRARYRGLLRNALVAAGNSGDASLAPLLERHAEGDDPLLAEHARWALARLRARQSVAALRAGVARQARERGGRAALRDALPDYDRTSSVGKSPGSSPGSSRNAGFDWAHSPGSI